MAKRRYYLNWMGPISMQWYRDRGLTKIVQETLKTNFHPTKKKGEIWEATRKTYNNNTHARNIVSSVFRPKYRYNPSQNVILNNKRTVNKVLTKSLLNKQFFLLKKQFVCYQYHNTPLVTILF